MPVITGSRVRVGAALPPTFELAVDGEHYVHSNGLVEYLSGQSVDIVQ